MLKQLSRAQATTVPVFVGAITGSEVFTPLHEEIVLVLDRDNGESLTEISRLLPSAASLLRFDDLVDAVAIVSRNSASRFVMFANIDCLNSIEDAVDALLAFRAAHPYTPVIIGSGSFARNEFSTERHAIADACIRLPCGRSGIALAISHAVANNGGAGRLI